MMASAALPHQSPHPASSAGPPAESLHQRMDQLFAMRQQQHEEQQQQQQQQDFSPPRTSEASAPPHSEYYHRQSPNSGHHGDHGGPHGDHEGASASGSASGEEDDRDMDGVKRMGGHINGMASKKRRKQSKPVKLGQEEAAAAAAAAASAGTNPEEEFRRYSTEEDERSSHIDSPLNLSSGNGGPSYHEPGERQPSLRILGPELMRDPSKDGSSPPKSEGGLASLYPGMLPFGLPPFPFPFPSQPMSSKAITSGAPTVSGAGPRSQIFNPEAYCELCNKEFCNKYFLKTHKANKHGIYSDSPGVSRSPGPNMSGQQSTPSRPGEDVREPMGPPTPNSQSGSPFSGAFIASTMGSLRPPFMPLSPNASHSPSPQQQHREQQHMQQQRESSSKGDTGISPRGERDIPSRGSAAEGSDPGMPNHSPRPPMLSPNDGRGSSISSMDRENGELRRSLESPRSLAHLSGFNPMMFGGIPSLESLRKDEEMRKDRPPIPNIPNVPTVSSSSGGPMPKGPFTPDKLRQMGVINADAFCEICCKEFCNKYFLRVHKLKKHGICSPDLPPEKVQKILNQMAKEASKTGNPPPQLVRPPMMPTVPEKRSSLPMSQMSPMPPLRPSSMFPSLPPLEPLMPQRPDKDVQSLMMKESEREREIIRINDDSEDSENARKEEGVQRGEEAEAKSPNAGDKGGAADLQRLQSMIMELNSSKNKEVGENICRICNKDLENKYYLRAHMMNDHGVLHMEEPPQMTVNGPPKEEDKTAFMNGAPAGKEPMDFTAKFLQQMQKGLPGLPGLDSEDRSFLERVKNELSGGSPKRLGDRDPNRKPASLSRSYCEICKKELCNKYFMKTHMLKMHGINIEAGNSAGVSCSICKKELCSKYFLKVHMQNSHGLMEDGSPLPPNFKENGGMFPGLFPMGAPPPELLGLPGSPDKDHYFSRLLGEQSELSRERLKELERQKQMIGNNGQSGHTCSLCGEGFPEIVALQVHIIKSHGAFPPDATPLAMDKPEDNNEPKQNDDKKDDEKDEKMDDAPAADPPTQNGPPPFPFPGLDGGKAAELASEAAKQFPHIEMLQRHMLSQQFPGLISPLFSGLPGFPNPFQQLLGSGAEKPPLPKPKDPEEVKTPTKRSNSEQPQQTKRKRFKCSKCSQKFPRRDLCLQHIQSTHASMVKRGSPHKRRRAPKARSQYVRQLMELLRVPTSRGTPQSPSKPDGHIMQPFLLKTPEEIRSEDFVPSLVYLPVAKRISEPLTVAFSLTPA